MVKYVEENCVYELDCTAAIWSTDKIHSVYQDRNHTYGEIGFLCDVDFVIENENNILLVEYKNADIPHADNPGAFNPLGGNKLENVAKKFYDSSYFLYLSGKDKPKKYIYVLEYPSGNSTSRLLVRNRLKEKLPFKLQSGIAVAGRELIDEVRVVNIAEWNADAELGKFPLQLLSAPAPTAAVTSAT